MTLDRPGTVDRADTVDPRGTVDRADLAGLAGAPESSLAAAALPQLPATAPPPPWPCRVEAVVWWQAAPPAALALLPPGPAPLLPLVVGALVRYLESPVGPYEEVIGAVVPRPLQVHVPLIAVDSPASLVGGRAHWALPKTLATFTRAPGGTEVVARGEQWRVAASPRPRGPRLPFVGRLRGVQRDAQGGRVTSTSTAWGRARLARVDVQVGTDLAGERGSIAGWLRSGRHPGVVLTARLRVAR